MTEQVLPMDSVYRIKLQAVAKMLMAFSKHDALYVVEETYLDYGQDWAWTTICRRGYMDCQVLCPTQWKHIMEAEDEVQLAKAVTEIRSNPYFMD